MQKDRGWMAGSKTGKLRGLNAKNKADLELFLNCSGSRVNSRKVQGQAEAVSKDEGCRI